MLALTQPGEDLHLRTHSPSDFDPSLFRVPSVAFGGHLESEAMTVAHDNARRWHDERGTCSENNPSTDIRSGAGRPARLDVRIDGRQSRLHAQGGRKVAYACTGHRAI